MANPTLLVGSCVMEIRAMPDDVMIAQPCAMFGLASAGYSRAVGDALMYTAPYWLC
jgi:hypothetical protein